MASLWGEGQSGSGCGHFAPDLALKWSKRLMLQWKNRMALSPSFHSLSLNIRLKTVSCSFLNNKGVSS